MRQLINRVMFVSQEPTLREVALSAWLAGFCDALFTALVVWLIYSARG